LPPTGAPARPGKDPLPGAPFETRRVTAIAGAHAVHDTSTAFLAPLLPRLIDRFSLSNTRAGLLATFLQLPGLLQPVIGHLADHSTIRWIVILAPGLTTTAMSVLGWAPTYAVLAVLLFAAGVSVAAFHAVAPVAVGQLSGNRLGKGMGFWMVGGELGRMIGPLVVVGVLSVLTLKGLAWLTILGWLASAVVYAELRRVPLSTGGAGAPPWRPALRAMRGVMGVLTAIIATRALASTAVVVYLPVFLTGEGSSELAAGASLSALEAAGIAGALVGGWLSDRLGRHPLLYAGHLLAPVFLVAFAIADGWLRIPLLLGFGFTLLSIQPVNLALVLESFPQSQALANGVYLSISFAIRSGAALMVGVLADAIGLRTTFIVSAIVMLAALPLIALLPGSRTRRTAS